MKYRIAKKILIRLCCDKKQHYRWSTIDKAMEKACSQTPRWKQPLGKHHCWCSLAKENWRQVAKEVWKW